MDHIYDPYFKIYIGIFTYFKMRGTWSILKIRTLEKYTPPTWVRVCLTARIEQQFQTRFPVFRSKITFQPDFQIVN